MANLKADAFDVDTTLLDGCGQWANLGDWRDAGSYDEACIALARRVGEAAALAPPMSVLDVACGYGGSVRLWVNAFGVSVVDAVDLRPACITALREASPPGLRHVFTAHVSETLELPATVRYDAVVSVDAAYHFASALDLGRLARRCLCPGGRLAYTTLIWGNPDAARPNWWCKLFLQTALIPQAAVMTPGALGAALADLGFSEMQISYLDDEVLSGFARYVTQLSSKLSLAHRLRPAWWKIWLTAQACRQLRAWGLRYALVRGVLGAQ
ncbi:MAG: methyltransferase domain-containing protein [Deltaproteobacteria bacterium]|nr:methyltransferase domain-containing protein [Deltaproteobacteria bacterium]